MSEIRGPGSRATIMLVVCGWCGKSSEKDGKGASGVTTTICDQCLASRDTHEAGFSEQDIDPLEKQARGRDWKV